MRGSNQTYKNVLKTLTLSHEVSVEYALAVFMKNICSRDSKENIRQEGRVRKWLVWGAAFVLTPGYKQANKKIEKPSKQCSCINIFVYAYSLKLVAPV